MNEKKESQQPDHIVDATKMVAQQQGQAAPPSAPVGVDLEQFREAVMFWKGWAAIGLAVEKIGPFTLRQEEDVYQQRVNEADRLLALIDRASPLQACNCPGEGKTDLSLHAPNCPVRLAQQPAAVDGADKADARRYRDLAASGKYAPSVNSGWALASGTFRATKADLDAAADALSSQHQEPTT